MQIAEFLAQSSFHPALSGQTKQRVLEELAESLAADHPELDARGLLAALWQRERLGSTAIAEGVAMPHAKLPGLTSMITAFGRHPEGVDFESLDGLPTRLFFVLVAPEDAAGLHLKALAQVSRLAKDPEFRQRALQADRKEVFRSIVGTLQSA